MFRWAFMAGVVAVASLASAQTFYQPVQYQYRTTTGHTFYYGGNNPQLLQWASNPCCYRPALRAFGFIPVPRSTHPFTAIPYLPVDQPPRVISDCDPLGVTGLTIADARNQAYARVPLYFRKGGPAEQLPTPAEQMPAEPAPATAPQNPRPPQGTIDIRPMGATTTRPAARPLNKALLDQMAQPGSIIILPSPRR